MNRMMKMTLCGTCIGLVFLWVGEQSLARGRGGGGGGRGGGVDAVVAVLP